MPLTRTRFALLDSLPSQGVVGVCEQATHSGDAPRCLELAHRYPWVYAAIGIHPESLLPAADCGPEGAAPTITEYGGDWAAEMRALAPFDDDPKVVAVGECGLDYHWPVPKDAQLALFEAELRLSLELGKPIIVHDRQAHADVYRLLKQYRPAGVLHCYSGSAEDAVWLAEQGMLLGFGGACTFKGAKRAAKAIAALPLENILLETDCPYMAPEPLRGRRCDSSITPLYRRVYRPGSKAWSRSRCSAKQRKMPAGCSSCNDFSPQAAWGGAKPPARFLIYTHQILRRDPL